VANPLTNADVTSDMRFRHAGQWRAYYIAAIPGSIAMATAETAHLIGRNSADVADVCLAEELNRIPRLQFLEDKTPTENTHGH
jgi:hypothetical protein